MNIHVYIDEKDAQQRVELKEHAVVEDLLKELAINPVTVIVTRANALITSSEKLKDNDTIKVLSVVSGG